VCGLIWGVACVWPLRIVRILPGIAAAARVAVAIAVSIAMARRGIE
jgi:hypothetical protein